MYCDLPAHSSQVLLIHCLERLCHSPVQQPFACAAQGSKGSLAQFIVAKVVCISPLLAHDAPLPEFIQPLHYGVFIALARLRQHLEGKCPSDDCRQSCQFSRGWRELCESCSNNRLYRRWQNNPMVINSMGVGTIVIALLFHHP